MANTIVRGAFSKTALRALAWFCVWAAASCAQVAPVRDQAGLAPSWLYATTHGRPLAFGGGVCTINAPHHHRYPPSPRAAFSNTAAGWFDTRKMWPYLDAHAQNGNTCHTVGWHLHLEPPTAALVYDADKEAWRAAAAAQ